MTYSRIVGTGRYLPEKIMTNADLEKIVDTSDEWIRTRTGVERRHVCAEDQTTSDMCIEAAKVAIDDAGVKPEDIDMVITGTTTPDLIFPNISTIIQHKLGIPACTAFSLEAACTGFIYALTTADNFLYAVPLAAAVSIIFWNDVYMSWYGVTLAILSGAIASGLGYALWYAVLAGMPATRAATAQLSVPVIAALGGVLLLSEPVTLRLIVSSVATLGGIALVLLQRGAADTKST